MRLDTLWNTGQLHRRSFVCTIPVWINEYRLYNAVTWACGHASLLGAYVVGSLLSSTLLLSGIVALFWAPMQVFNDDCMSSLNMNKENAWECGDKLCELVAHPIAIICVFGSNCDHNVIWIMSQSIVCIMRCSLEGLWNYSSINSPRFDRQIEMDGIVMGEYAFALAWMHDCILFFYYVPVYKFPH